MENKVYEKKTAEIKELANELNALIDKYDDNLSVKPAKSRTSSDTACSSDNTGEAEAFETARLIVYADNYFDEYGAVAHLSGYENMHILQYETPEQAKQAYDKYSNNKHIDSAEPDIILSLEEDIKTSPNSDYDYSDTPEDGIKHSWGYDYIQTPDAFQYILGHIYLQELPEIVVAVIDDGIGKGDEEFNKRLLKAYTFLGDNTDPYIPTGFHGTRVAAVIYENTLPNVKFVSYQTFKNGKSTLSLTSLAEYQAALDLDLTCADENAEIYYTLDKTIPSKENGILYTKPIELAKTSTVYAVAYSRNGAKSEIAKRTLYIRILQTSDPDENGWLIRKNGMIYGYVGTETDLVVPETVFEIKVIGIEARAFEGQSWLSSIVIPESISTIGERAFSNCDNLTEITANGITAVSKYAFSNCYCLDKVNMPKLEKVSSYAFYHTGALDGLPFESLTNISSNAFTGANVVYLHLDSAESIGTGAFSSCNQLVEAYLPKIASENCATYVFQNCNSIEKVVFGSKFDCLPGYMFWKSGLVKADFFSDIVYSDPGAFGCCDSLA